ncbi:MAG TPA: ABC transporter substrate-binding protein [Actinomycetota bacterium]|nr:ABC transporter substrate-binding protein [Actinomycetota bacterium]
MKRQRILAISTVAVLLLVACSNAVLVERRTGEAAGAEGDLGSGPLASSDGKGGKAGSGDELSEGGAGSLNLGSGSGPGGGGGGGPGGGGRTMCATNSNPDDGFTAETLKIGTILPLTGSSRPLGEQAGRAMKVSTEQIMNRQSSLGGAYKNYGWGCPERPGIFGRRVELEVFSMQNNTPEEALAGMRRLIAAENVFTVRDCYLQDELMGAAAQYQNQQQVPAVWCHYSGMPLPELAPWSFAPGTNPEVQTAINTAYDLKKGNKKRIAILADPTHERTLVPVVKRVASHFGRRIPSDCIVYKRIQEASRGMRGEVARMRTCYGAANPTDMVVALDAVLATFAALEAEDQGWKPANSGVSWTCTGTSCWAVVLADICGRACEGMTTNSASLPFVPTASAAKYPAVKIYRDIHRRYLSQDPPDILTYAPIAITSGIALWLQMTGPDLSRERFAHTLGNLRNWDAGIGPVINTSDADHFGANATWVIKFTGRAPWFDDVSGRFVTLDQLGVPASAVDG